MGIEQALVRDAPHYVNIVGKLAGWGRDGVSRVEVTADVPGLPLGSIIDARVAEDVRRKHPIDFAFRKKEGLRVGGTVLLRRCRIEGSEVVCKEVDMLAGSQRDGPCVTMRDSAVFLHKPDGRSLAPSGVTIAPLPMARQVSSLDDATECAVAMVEDVRIFGSPSLLFTGLDDEGAVFELPVPLPGGQDEGFDVAAAMRAAVDADSRRLMTEVDDRWWLVAGFFGEIDPDPNRRSKFAALYANSAYGEPDEALWSRANAVIRGFGQEWFVADATPIEEPTDVDPRLLYDLLANR